MKESNIQTVTQNLMLLSAVAFAVAGPLLAVGWGIDYSANSVLGRSLVMFSNAILPVALVACYAPALARTPGLGMFGIVVASLGNVSMSTVTFATLAAAAGIDGVSGLMSSGPFRALGTASGLALLVGYVCLGIALLRGREIPSPVGGLIITGIVALFVGAGPIGVRPLAVTGAVLLGGGVTWLGTTIGSRDPVSRSASRGIG